MPATSRSATFFGIAIGVSLGRHVSGAGAARSGDRALEYTSSELHMLISVFGLTRQPGIGRAVLESIQSQRWQALALLGIRSPFRQETRQHPRQLAGYKIPAYGAGAALVGYRRAESADDAEVEKIGADQ